MSDRIVGLLTIVSLDTPFGDEDARMAERLGVQAAVAIDNALLHEQLRDQATRDGLTGLPNHRTLQDSLSDMLEESNRMGTPLGVVLLDIDNFKRVNDTYGHPTGDEAIKAIGRVLETGIGAMGMAGRFGGEEFVLLIPGLDAEAVARIADRLREDVTKIEIPLDDGGTLRITSSFGVANVDQNPGPVTTTELLHQADVGMYNAKRTGKNRVVIAGPDTESVEMSEADIAALAARERGESTASFVDAGSALNSAPAPARSTLLPADAVPELADGEDDFFSDAA
jgi:diguanylate cyclase (GGDEF)-like protein